MPTPRPCEKCDRDYYPLRRGYCSRCDMQRRARRGYQCSFVDAQPVRRHVAALRKAGIGLRRLSELSGVSRSALTCLVNGRPERGSPPNKRVSAATAEAILAVPLPARPCDEVADHQLVDAIGTVRRLQSLVALGHPRSHLAKRLGIAPANATRLFDSATLRVTAATARKVIALFDELQATPGPSERARSEGRRRGWEVPLAWDDDELDHFRVNVDSVDEEGSDDRELTFVELYAELRYLGYSDIEIAHREGIAIESLHRRLSRAEVTAVAVPAEVSETFQAAFDAGDLPAA